MSDYISREAALAALYNRAFDKAYTDGEYRALVWAARQIKSLPAADVRPVAKGTWEMADSYAGPGLMNLRCSVCGGFGGTWRDNTLPSMLYNFCPNCGADIREEQND